MNTVNIERTREIASQADDVTTPTFQILGDKQRGFPMQGFDQQEAMTEACRRASNLWVPTVKDRARTDVFKQFAKNLSRIRLVSTHHGENNAEWHWAPVRILLAGAGHAAHRKLSEIIGSQYMVCDLNPSEKKDVWEEALVTAHKLCGWPVTLSLASYQSLRSVVGIVPRDEAVIEPWMRAVALLHVLKHVRYDNGALIITYQGSYLQIPLPPKGNQVANRTTRPAILDALGAAVVGGKEVNPLDVAVGEWLLALNTSNILSRRPTSRLPGRVFHGPWTQPVPDPRANENFIQHGLTLTRISFAAKGKVRPYTDTDDDDIVGYSWETSAPTDDTFDAYRKFQDSLPSTYDDTKSPWQILQEAWPNIDTGHLMGDPRGLGLQMDALFCASVMRSEVPGLNREFPLVLVMPKNPTVLDSTNQGKTMLTEVIGRAMTPSIEARRYSDTESAPNIRSLAAEIETYGSLCLDEWTPARKPAHPLSHDNLQSLCTGGSVNIGKAFENCSNNVRISQSIVASCKALISAPPDVINRTICLYLDHLSQAQLEDVKGYEEAKSGRLACRVRLAALAMCDRHNLGRVLRETGWKSSKSWRFNGLRTLGEIIGRDVYRYDDAGDAIDSAAECNRITLNQHTIKARNSGLVDRLQFGIPLVIGLDDLFQDISTVDLQTMLASYEERGEHGVPLRDFCSLRRGAAGFDGSLIEMASRLTGRRYSGSDKLLMQALEEDVVARMPQVGDSYRLPGVYGAGGWRVVRKTRDPLRLSLEHNPPAPVIGLGQV